MKVHVSSSWPENNLETRAMLQIRWFSWDGALLPAFHLGFERGEPSALVPESGCPNTSHPGFGWCFSVLCLPLKNTRNVFMEDDISLFLSFPFHSLICKSDGILSLYHPFHSSMCLWREVKPLLSKVKNVWWWLWSDLNNLNPQKWGWTDAFFGSIVE